MDDKPASGKYEPPQPDERDTAYTVGRAALASVPYIGGPAVELLQLVFVPPIEKRRGEWAEEVAQALRDLENRGVKLEELQSDETFIDTVMYASQIVLRNSQEEKREALRNAILNAGLPSPPEAALQQMFLNLVDTYTVWHLRLLKLFHNVQRWAQDSGRELPEISGSLAKILESAYPSLQGNRTLYDQVWQDLYQRGLVNVDSLHTMMDGYGLMARRTSELGAQFLRFIEEPE